MSVPIPSNEKKLFQYSGIINQGVSNILLREIKYNLLPKLEHPIPTKRIYQAFVETIENVIKYNGIVQDKEVTLYLTRESEESIHYTIQNIILKEDALLLDQRLKWMLSLRKEDLKRTIRKILGFPNTMEKNGAGLGLMILISKNNQEIDYFFDNLDDQNTLFSLTFNFRLGIK